MIINQQEIQDIGTILALLAEFPIKPGDTVRSIIHPEVVGVADDVYPSRYGITVVLEDGRGLLNPTKV